MKLSEAILENTKTLLEHYKKGEISKKEILELEQEAIEDEEYEVAISIKEVLDIIDSDWEKKQQILEKIVSKKPSKFWKESDERFKNKNK